MAVTGLALTRRDVFAVQTMALWSNVSKSCFSTVCFSVDLGFSNVDHRKMGFVAGHSRWWHSMLWFGIVGDMRVSGQRSTFDM